MSAIYTILYQVFVELLYEPDTAKSWGTMGNKPALKYLSLKVHFKIKLEYFEPIEDVPCLNMDSLV